MPRGGGAARCALRAFRGWLAVGAPYFSHCVAALLAHERGDQRRQTPWDVLRGQIALEGLFALVPKNPSLAMFGDVDGVAPQLDVAGQTFVEYSNQRRA